MKEKSNGSLINRRMTNLVERWVNQEFSSENGGEPFDLVFEKLSREEKNEFCGIVLYHLRTFMSDMGIKQFLNDMCQEP